MKPGLRSRALALLPALSLSLQFMTGCGSIEQQAKPVTLSAADTRTICVIEDASVRAGFLEAYKNDLAQKGLTVRVMPGGTALNACPLISTYEAHWKWDLALYLAYADLKVYRNGQLAGEALYDAKLAALNTNKFIDADNKIQELTNQLFASQAG